MKILELALEAGFRKDDSGLYHSAREEDDLRECLTRFGEAAFVAGMEEQLRRLAWRGITKEYPLPDFLYPDSKDWLASDYAGRVEWLHKMYEGKKKELEAYLETR